jgi:hypothetical protein
VQTVLSFLAGGVVGVLVYRTIGSELLFGAAAVLLVMAFVGIVRAHALRNELSIPPA